MELEYRNDTFVVTALRPGLTTLRGKVVSTTRANLHVSKELVNAAPEILEEILTGCATCTIRDRQTSTRYHIAQLLRVDPRSKSSCMQLLLVPITD